MEKTTSTKRVKLVKKLARALNKKAQADSAHAPISQRTDAGEEVVEVLEELRDAKADAGSRPPAK